MGSRATTQADAPLRWLMSALAGLLASGGLAGWAIGGWVGSRELGAVLGMLAGGFVAGAALGRYRDLVPASLAAAAPLALIGLFVVTAGILVDLARAATLIIAAVQAFCVVIGGGLGVAASRRFAIGPVRSAAAIGVLAVAAGAVVAGWLWFALTLTRRS
jgi:hypothetical protein